MRIILLVAVAYLVGGVELDEVVEGHARLARPLAHLDATERLFGRDVKVDDHIGPLHEARPAEREQWLIR